SGSSGVIFLSSRLPFIARSA
ncbi:hypothetical protein ACNPC4_25355, partial [Klebsiella pneumoniae]|nr:hypothetical protein [Escherichia coli]